MTTEIPDGLSEAQKEFFELMTRKEELHPELVPYLEKNPNFGATILKHPLVFELFYTPQFNARINRIYEHKLQYVQEKMAAKEWSSAIWMYERPYRMQQFLEWRNELTDEEYWDLLASIWTDSENLWQYGPILGYLLKNKRPGREKMMNEEEKAFLASLPDKFTIYRGHQGRRNRNGWSWSLSYFKAKWFSKRTGEKNDAVVEALANKSDVIAYLSARNEYEIIINPDDLEIKTIKPRKRPAWMQEILDEALENFSLSKKFSHHGIFHWEKVERNALKLAKITPKCDPKVVQLFALLHDSKRINEDDDPEHGHRSAKYVETLYENGKLQITETQKEKLVFACKFHNDGQVTDDPTIGACWDADRLDLTRVGITPDPKFMSTKAGKDMIWQM